MVSRTRTRRRSKTTQVVLTILVLGFFQLFAPTVASATNFGSAGTPGTGGTTNGVWLTNNFFWNVGKMSLTATYSTGVDQAVEQEYERSDIDGAALTPATCDDAGYDVCVFDENYGDNGLNGWDACAGTTTGAHPNQQCSLAWVRINTFYSPPAKRIACHELGHSVGLRHTTDAASCLRTSASGGTSSVLPAHDIAHLNAAY